MIGKNKDKYRINQYLPSRKGLFRLKFNTTSTHPREKVCKRMCFSLNFLHIAHSAKYLFYLCMVNFYTMRACIISLFALAVAVFCACANKEKPKETSKHKVLTVAHTDRTLLSEYSARLTGRQVVEVRPQVSGLITRICIEEGQTVKKGQLLFVIDQAPYRAALKEAVANVTSAQAALANAKTTLESTQTLYDNHVVGDYEMATARNNHSAAEAALAQAKAQEENARNDLSYTEVKSPVDGVAGMITYRVGALVSSSIDEPLVTVSDCSVVYAYFSLTEAQIIDLAGQYGSIDKYVEQSPDVELRMSNGSAYAGKGRISAVSGIVSANTNAVTLRADFPNSEGLLHEGGSGTVIVPTVMTGCIVIPQTATFELQDRIFAYKVVDGKATSVQIEVFRLNNGTEYVVESGLEEGDVIVAEGAGLIKEGQSIVK